MPMPGIACCALNYGGNVAIPTSLGTHVATSGSSTAISSATLAAVPAGAIIFVAVSINSSSLLSVSGVTDTAGNVYASAGTAPNDGAHVDLELWVCKSALPMAINSTITANLSGSIAGGAPQAAILAGFTTGQPTFTEGYAKQLAAASTTPSVSTGALTRAPALIIGLAVNDAGGAETQASGFTNLSGTLQNSLVTRLDYNLVNATTSVTYNPTWSIAGNCLTIVLSIK